MLAAMLQLIVRELSVGNAFQNIAFYGTLVFLFFLLAAQRHAKTAFKALRSPKK
nr:hypothetical protein [Mucilaginibacter sp. SP1R1]